MNPMMKKREVSSSQGTWKPLAHGISEVTNPLFLACPTFLVVAFASAPDILHALLWWLIAVVGISVVPFLFVLRGVRQGRYSDHHVSIREQRLIPLVFGLVSIGIAFLLLFLLHASLVLMATMTAVIVVLIIATIITRFWKISLHVVGIAGAVTVCVLLFGPRLLLLAPLVALVAWARWQVGAHTPLQAVAGTVLAVTVTVMLFWAFGVL
jgi:membrane-associated phospholipid phosphatase